MEDLPENATHPLSRAEWRAWLERNHTRPQGVWLVNYKKNTGKPRVEYDEAVEEAICFGWIDSKSRTLDDQRSMQWFAPPNSRPARPPDRAEFPAPRPHQARSRSHPAARR